MVGADDGLPPAGFVLADVARQPGAQPILEIRQATLRLGVRGAAGVAVGVSAGAGVIRQSDDAAKKSEDMLVGIGHPQRAGLDLLLGGRCFVPDPLRFAESRLGDGSGQDTAQAILHHLPLAGLRFRSLPALGLVGAVGRHDPTRLQTVDGRHGIVVAAVPLSQQRRVLGRRDGRMDPLVFIRRDCRRQGPPAVAVAQQHDEVGARGDPLATRDLAQADGHRLLVKPRFLAYAPAQVHRLEAAAVLPAQLAEPGKHPLLQGVALLLQVAEGG